MSKAKFTDYGSLIQLLGSQPGQVTLALGSDEEPGQVTLTLGSDEESSDNIIKKIFDREMEEAIEASKRESNPKHPEYSSSSDPEFAEATGSGTKNRDDHHETKSAQKKPRRASFRSSLPYIRMGLDPDDDHKCSHGNGNDSNEFDDTIVEPDE